MKIEILTYDQIKEYIYSFDVIKYCKTRNFINGGVSKLSPYITHGVITLSEIINISLSKYPLEVAESWYKELLRREYFLQVHFYKGDIIFEDMESDKTNIPKNDILPKQVIDKSRKSTWVNTVIDKLETVGYLHNHERMRLASYMTHWQKLYRLKMADWSYYHFIDGELASNHLSWQWVTSTFAHKPYYMNEDNLKKYANFVDPIYRGEYDQVEANIFDPHRQTDILSTDLDYSDTLQTNLDDVPFFDIKDIIGPDISLLTPRDMHPTKAISNSICIMDIDFFDKHPRSQARIDFIKSYCNIYNIKIYKGSLSQIINQLNKNNISIKMYKTINPFYRQAQEQYMNYDNIELANYERVTQVIKNGYIKKFFPFWEKNRPKVYEMQRNIKNK